MTVSSYRQFINLSNNSEIDFNNCIEISIINSNDVATAIDIKDIGEQGLELLYKDVIIGGDYIKSSGEIGLESPVKTYKLNLSVKVLNKFFVTLLENESYNEVVYNLPSPFNTDIILERVPTIKIIQEGELLFFGCLIEKSFKSFPTEIELIFLDTLEYVKRQLTFKELIDIVTEDVLTAYNYIEVPYIYNWLRNDGAGSENKFIAMETVMELSKVSEPDWYNIAMLNFKEFHEMLNDIMLLIIRQVTSEINILGFDDLTASGGDFFNKILFAKRNLLSNANGDFIGINNVYMPFAKINDNELLHSFLNDSNFDNVSDYTKNLFENYLHKVSNNYTLNIDVNNQLIEITEYEINYIPISLDTTLNIPYEFIYNLERSDDLRIKKIEISQNIQVGEDLNRIELSKKATKNTGMYVLNNIYRVEPVATKNYRRFDVSGPKADKMLNVFDIASNNLYYIATEQAGLSDIIDVSLEYETFLKVSEITKYPIDFNNTISNYDILNLPETHNFWDTIKSQINASSFHIDKYLMGVLDMQINNNTCISAAHIILELFKHKKNTPLIFTIDYTRFKEYLQSNEIDISIKDIFESNYYIYFDLSESLKITESHLGDIGDKYESFAGALKNHIVTNIEYDIISNQIEFELIGINIGVFT